MADDTVLIVDDEAAVLGTLRELLAGVCRVRTAGGAAEALAILESGPVAVVVSDFRMPGADGIALLCEVKRRWPACARVLMTAFADMELVVRAMNEGEVHRFIAKPFALADFRRILDEARAIGRVLAGGPGAARPGGTPTVVVAHDSRITQSTLRLLLGPGYRVVTTGSGIEALSLLTDGRAAAGVLGVKLELLDGWTLASYLRRERRLALPLVLWGSGVDGPYRDYLLECGADLVLDEHDPAAPESLRRLLDEALRRPAAGGAPPP